MIALLAALHSDPDLLWALIVIGVLAAAFGAAVLIVMWVVLCKLNALDRDVRDDIKTLFHAMGRLEGRVAEEDRRPH